MRDELISAGYKKKGKYLNLGCGKEYYDTPKGWVNLDGDPKIKADIYCDLDQKDLTMPFKDGTFDIIWASHIFEHIFYLGALKRELARICKPGGALTFIVPYYLFPDAWGDDTHVRAFSEAACAGFMWPGFGGEGAVFGHLPTKNYACGPDDPKEEFWLWSTRYADPV